EPPLAVRRRHEAVPTVLVEAALRRRRIEVAAVLAPRHGLLAPGKGAAGVDGLRRAVLDLERIGSVKGDVAARRVVNFDAAQHDEIAAGPARGLFLYVELNVAGPPAFERDRRLEVHQPVHAHLACGGELPVVAGQADA